MEFPIPAQLNGVQLQKELEKQGIVLKDYPRIVNEKLILDINAKDEAKASTIVANHVGVFEELTIVKKIESLGISIDDLKIALGI